MRRPEPGGGRAADRGSAVKPEARQGLPSCPLGACRGCTLWRRAVRFLGRKEGDGRDGGHGMGSASAAVVRCPCQRCAWSSGWACPPPVLASRTRTRHGSSGTIIIMTVRAESSSSRGKGGGAWCGARRAVPYCTCTASCLFMGWVAGCHSFGAFHALE